MLAAILGGKISSQVEGSEDLLTSVVFGVLEHLPVEHGVARLLALAAGDSPVDAAIRSSSGFRIEYWPWWSEDGQEHGAEPDVALWLEGTDGRRRLVVVEAKRSAGKSGHGERDQLARQAANGLELARRSDAIFAGAVYLTAHVALPSQVLAASRAAMVEHFGLTAPPPLWWVSWRDLVAVFDEASQRSDNPVVRAQSAQVAQCLRKWGLVHFTGFTAVPAVPAYRFEVTS